MYGSIEALMVDGTQISPMTTWDSKITTVLAMMGGITDIIQRRMVADKVYDSFISKVNQEWGLVFTSIKGLNIGYGFPKAPIPQARPDFNTCSTYGEVKTE